MSFDSHDLPAVARGYPRTDHLLAALLALLLLPTTNAQSDRQIGGLSAHWNVAIVVHQGVELLDLAGPGEVFEAAARRGMRDERPWFNVYTVAPTPGVVVSQRFLTIIPEFTIENAPAPDILVIPGGSTGVLRHDDEFMQWVGARLDDTQITLTVCTGAFVLADLSALDGKEITTHWSALDALRRETRDATVRDDVRFADNTSIITAAGVSAGIDGALHVVARLLGYQHARQTAHYMQYEWRPSDEAVATYAPLNPQLDEIGRALQEAALLSESGRTDEAIARYRSVICEDPTNAVAWYGLGSLLHERGDLKGALQAHLKAAEFGSGRIRIDGRYNAACVYALLGRSDEALSSLEQCARAGAGHAQWAMEDQDLAAIHNHPRFRIAVAEMWINNARALLKRKRHAPAIEALREAAWLGYSDFGSILVDPSFRPLHTDPAFRELQRRHSCEPNVNMVFDDEPGQTLVVSGVVRDRTGQPIPGALMYIFNADGSGWYARTGAMDEPNARIYGYLRTDEQGHYQFRTVRPGGYPVPDEHSNQESHAIPAHIHVQIRAPGYEPYNQQWAFADDPRMTEHWYQWAEKWERSILSIQLNEDGIQRTRNDDVLMSRSEPGGVKPRWATPRTVATADKTAGPPAVIDLDHDGHLDLLVPCEDPDDPRACQLAVFLGDGTGRFRRHPAKTTISVHGARALALALGELNHDTHPDVVIGQHDSYDVAIMLGDGSGAFAEGPQPRVTAHDGANPHTHSVVLADVNGDSHLDILTTCADDNAVAVLLGNGRGRFIRAPNSPCDAGNQPYEGLSVGSFNNDGTPDVAVPNLWGSAVSILLGDGHGGFKQADTSPFPVGARPGFLTVGDLNEDDDADLVVTHDDDPIVDVLIGDGNGRMTAAACSPIRLNQSVWTAVIADVDHDADNDIVLGGSRDRLFVLLGDGTGAFKDDPIEVRAPRTGPGYVIVGDVNEDGKCDLIVAYYESDVVDVAFGE
jgi:transcriptional regulator GlxA family with amidase domain/protocatechuate 3,4-dioxygenase beta subunit